METTAIHTPQKTGYFPRLDELRFFAFLLVFINHVTSFLYFPTSVHTFQSTAFTFLQMGDLGVGFFFVLSGFLITFLLEREQETTQRISFKNFYIRRVLRIWPLYFLALGIIIGLSYLLRGFGLYVVQVDPKEIFAHLLFVGNIFRAFEHTSNEMIAIFWSIAVEEQFYLVWPAIYSWGRKYLPYILGLGILISMGVRYAYANNFEVREFFTPSVMVYLWVGAFIGVYGKQIFDRIQKKSVALKWSAVGGVIALLAIRGYAFPHAYAPWFIAIDGLIFAVLFALIILDAAYRTSENGSGGVVITPIRKAIGYLGRISFGLYVYHLIALTLVLYGASKLGVAIKDIGAATFYPLAIIAGITVIGISAVSYRYWERPFLRLKDRFISRTP